jgi:glutamate-1-semialdehyde 2,1-aminomutase
MAANADPITIDRTRIAELTERETERLNEATKGSGDMFARANEHLASGVASSYQVREPWPIYLERGDGPKVWDVDGNEMWDFHNGFGSMVQGHAHPAIGQAIKDRYDLGTHFAAPTEDAIVVGDELARRWGLPKWRYTNSGSESTMDAIRIARAATGRDDVLKIFGSYHGHHDTVMVSIGVEYDKIGDHDHPVSLAYGGGIPQSTVDHVFAVHFNDAESMERRIEELDKEGRKPACVIMEPAMMNLGVVLPEEGYLEAVREITAKHGVVLIFDEVKTGLTVAPGGATDKYGVLPDMVTLAKALGGGLPSGAIGMNEEMAKVVEDGTVYQVGTYNGNPLGMAASRANLLDVQDHRLRDLQGPAGRGDRRVGLVVQHEPRHLHDAGPRGGVDALGDPHRRVRRPVRRGVRRDGEGPDVLERLAPHQRSFASIPSAASRAVDAFKSSVVTRASAATASSMARSGRGTWAPSTRSRATSGSGPSAGR